MGSICLRLSFDCCVCAAADLPCGERGFHSWTLPTMGWEEPHETRLMRYNIAPVEERKLGTGGNIVSSGVSALMRQIGRRLNISFHGHLRGRRHIESVKKSCVVRNLGFKTRTSFLWDDEGPDVNMRT